MTDAQQKASMDKRGIVTSPGMLTVHCYDMGTGVYTETKDIFRPVGQGIPAGTTMVTLPEIPSGQAAVFNSDTQTWGLVADHRGESVYLKSDGSKVTINSVGNLPDDVVPSAPSQSFMKWNNQKNNWEDDPDSRLSAMKSQAQGVMAKVMTIMQQNGWGTFQPTPSDVTAYASALVKIINKEDSEVRELPQAPADLPL